LGEFLQIPTRAATANAAIARQSGWRRATAFIPKFDAQPAAVVQSSFTFDEFAFYIVIIHNVVRSAVEAKMIIGKLFYFAKYRDTHLSFFIKSCLSGIFMFGIRELFITDNNANNSIVRHVGALNF